MPSERLAMRRVRDVIRLKEAGLSLREIARRVGAAPIDGSRDAQVRRRGGSRILHPRPGVRFAANRPR